MIIQKKRNFRVLLILLIIIINVGCDQLSKRVIRQKMEYNQRIHLLEDYFTLTRVENSGAFLGLGANLPPLIKKLVFSIIPAIVLGLALFFLLMNFHRNKLNSIGFCFMIGGGIGNVFDRIVYDAVTDFLHFDLGFVSTGIFNLADVSIMVGLILVIIQHLLPKKEIQHSNLA